MFDPDMKKPSLNTQPRPMLPAVGHPERVSKVNALPDVRSCSVKIPLRLTICLIVKKERRNNAALSKMNAAAPLKNGLTSTFAIPLLIVSLFWNIVYTRAMRSGIFFWFICNFMRSGSAIIWFKTE